MCWASVFSSGKQGWGLNVVGLKIVPSSPSPYPISGTHCFICHHSLLLVYLSHTISLFASDSLGLSTSSCYDFISISEHLLPTLIFLSWISLWLSPSLSSSVSIAFNVVVSVPSLPSPWLSTSSLSMTTLFWTVSPSYPIAAWSPLHNSLPSVVFSAYP